MKNRAMIAALVVCACSTASMAQFTINGRIDTAEAALYQLQYTNSQNPTGFGDNVTGAGLQPSGDPAAVNTGMEIAIPFSAIPGYNGGPIKIMAIINGSGNDFFSNQVIGSLPINTTNLGNPRNVNFATIAGNQFVSFTPATAGAAPAVDGTRDSSYGNAIALQQNFTQFGNAQHGQFITGSGGNGSEIDGLYAVKNGTTLYVMLTGNVEANFNKLNLFIEVPDGPAGQNRLLAGNAGQGGFGNMIDNGTGNGLTFDTGFAPNYWISMTGGNVGNNVFRFFGDFVNIGQGTGAYIGTTEWSATNTNPVLAEGSPIGIAYMVNNSNTAGVSGSPSGTSDLIAPSLYAAYGSEIDAVYTAIDPATNKLRIMVTGNFESNRNKLQMWFDVGLPGQNTVVVGNPVLGFPVDMTRLGGPVTAGDPPTNQPGLTFDAGFNANYYISMNTSQGGEEMFMDATIINSGGKRTNFLGNSLDVASFSGGGRRAAGNIFEFNGPTDGSADLGFVGQVYSNYAPRHLSQGGVPGISVPTGGLIRYSFDNSNVAGVTGTTASAAAAQAVRTGAELEIDLRELGWNGTSPIKISGYILSPDLDFMSNQVFGGLPANAANLGEPRNVNFASIAGDQFITITVPPACLPDYNGDTVLNTDDISDFITDYFTVPEVAGPGGYSGPCAGAPAPYDTLGYKVDINRDCVVNTDDISDFITAYFGGC